jgi:Tfp pilus assembly protein PilO
MRSIRLREQLLGGSAGLLALGAAFYLFIYSPVTSQAAVLTRQLEAQRADVERLQKDANREKELEHEIADLHTAIGILDAKFPSVREIAQLLLQLDDLASQTGVTLTSVKPGVLAAVTASPAAASAGRPQRGRGATPPAPAAPRRGGSQAPQTDTTHYRHFTIDLETTGTFSATLRFVHGLEDSLRFLTLSNIRLTPAPAKRGDDPADPALSLHVTATGYVRPESGDIP